MTEISTPIYGLALALSEYSNKDIRRILKIARHRKKMIRLASEELTKEQELDQTIKELEEEQ